MAVKPYYQHRGITIYHGCAEAILPDLDLSDVDLCLTDPPYPNRAGHFDASVDLAKRVLASVEVRRLMVFWHQLECPPSRFRLIAHHIWHRSNTNRQDNYEAIYEFADEQERSSRMFSHPVIYPGLTGCTEATGHPTQKNVRLLQELINLRKSRYVIDPFMGSGSTQTAAKKENFRAIGIEIEEKWCEVSARRLAQENLFWEGDE